MNFDREPMIEPEDGLRAPTLREYAKAHAMTEDKVWELIEEGELSARFVNDTILIFREQERTDIPLVDDQPVESISQREADLPQGSTHAGEIRPIAEAKASSPQSPAHAESEKHEPDTLGYVAAPSDSSDLLLFAQDALARTMDLSQQLLATKDELLRLRDEKIQWLEKQLTAKDDELRRVKRELENFATLQNISRNPSLLRDLHKTEP